ncbi:unnamed protein product [Periconia digitata]|uniref:Uncharacterized protein n=1 Tax=Periconia digitata TaxID=1303443 RepID=A0A9W4UT67_9PLEO|nr:unnamed protein product [Periconia digitata]
MLVVPVAVARYNGCARLQCSHFSARHVSRDSRITSLSLSRVFVSLSARDVDSFGPRRCGTGFNLEFFISCKTDGDIHNFRRAYGFGSCKAHLVFSFDFR